MSVTHLDAIPTPFLLLDEAVMQANLRRAQELADAAGKGLRPHAKTHKCSRICRRQLDEGALGICAAKVGEADALLDAGISPVLITSPIASPLQAARLLQLRATGADVMIVLDHRDGADILQREAAARGVQLPVLIDLDVGQHRTGVIPEEAPALAASLKAHCPHLQLCGLQAYAGNLQHITDFQERRRASLAALAPAGDVFRTLRAEDDTIAILTGSGTGCFTADLQASALTDFQLGSYAVMDVEYQDLGSAADPGRFTEFPPALTITSTVISTNVPGKATIDAGLKAIYQDGPPPRVITAGFEHLRFTYGGDEHGYLHADPGQPLPAWGQRIQLLTGHCDPTINLHNCFIVRRADGTLEEWPIDARGRCW